jgi:hypothetical protein
MGKSLRGILSGPFRQIVLLLSFFLLFPALSSAQNALPEVKVSIHAKNRTIPQILDEITLQTGYHFTYDAALIEAKEKVRFKVTELSLKESLDSLLRDASLEFKVIERNIVLFRKNLVLPEALSQEIDRAFLRGRVTDRRSGKALPFATIALLETSLGSITNQEGEFSFKIPMDLKDPMLMVSYMGYKKLIRPVTYPIESVLELVLEKETIPLQEVIIRYADPVKLLNEAIGRIPENYLEEHSTMTAFYRESVKRNEHYMIYSEAVLDVAKTPYTAESLKDQVSIRRRRKITDLTAEDTIFIKLRSGISTALNLDIIKNRPDFMKDDFLNRYDLEFTDMMAYGDRLVYVVSFEQKAYIPELLFKGQIYMDQESLAILAADFEFNPDLIHKEPEMFLVSTSPKIRIRPVMARYHVNYRSINNQFYVSQVRGEVEMKVRKRRKWISSRYRISIEMAITDLIPGQRLRINRSERVSRNMVLADEPFRFEPEFWGIHNTIKPEASLMESIEKLEHNQQEISE